MKHLSVLAAVAAVGIVAVVSGCGGDDPITQDTALIGSWSAQTGWESTITLNADGTCDASITNPEDQDDPIIQTGTWYTQGGDLVLTSPSGNVTRMEYSVNGNTFTRLDDGVVWIRI